MKKLGLLVVLLLLTSALIFASLPASSIFYANTETLKNMCQLRGLEITGGDEELRNRLYEYEGLDSYRESVENSKNEYEVKILSANGLEKDNDRLVLSGSASISFKSGEDKAKTLSATEIIIDAENSKLTALGGVSFTDDSENATLSEVSADIITVFWKSGKLIITDALTNSNRDQNSGDDVKFYTQGREITYLPSGGIAYSDGYITSDPDTRYSSISASRILILPGQDLFLSGARLSIGRVPLLYVPFFFFPGTRILGNPAFGFSSDKGPFLNTTFEVLGTYPKIKSSSNESSFAALFKNGVDDSDEYVDGFHYGKKSELSDKEKWAKSSGSYAAILADAYGGNGIYSSEPTFDLGAIHLGLDSSLNFLSKKVQLTFFDGIGLSDKVSGRADDTNLRYYGINTLKLSTSSLKADLSIPYYSDPQVLEDFGNRIIGFSIDSLFGVSPDFPTTYSSTISSFSRSMNLSYSLPSKYSSKLLSSFSISSLKVSSSYTWANPYKSSSSSLNKAYRLDYLEIPTLTATASGTIYDLSKTVSKSENVEENEVDITEESIYQDRLLMPLYTERLAKTETKTTKFNSSLKYSITENMKGSEDYSYGEIYTRSSSSSTSGRITFNVGFTDFFTITDSLIPSYTTSTTTQYNTAGVTNAYTLTENESTTMSNEVTLSIPKIGITYTLGTKLISEINNQRWTKSAGSDTLTPVDSYNNSSSLNLGWNKDTVTKHKIGFSHSFTSASGGTLTPSVSYTIAPLVGSLEPMLSYTNGSFASALSWIFEEDEDTFSYKSDMIQLSIGYIGTYFTLSTTTKYQSKNFNLSDDPLKPLTATLSSSIRSKDKSYSLTASADYEYFSESNNSIFNYFSSIKTVAVMPNLQMTMNWKTDLVTEKIAFSNMNISASLKTQSIQFWKRRIYLAFGLNSSLYFSKEDPSSSSFTFNPSLIFSIAEFMDIQFTLNSYNNKIGSYYDSTTNSYDFSSLFADLGRSLDIFGDGIYNTNFLMKGATLSFVHYMKDWDLHCQYSATVTSSSNNVYSLTPKFTVYLSWKTMPELEVDQKWKKTGSTWEEI